LGGGTDIIADDFIRVPQGGAQDLESDVLFPETPFYTAASR
jgi:hypothetical protein